MIFLALNLSSQKSIIYQTRDSIETGNTNIIVEGDESYYILATTASIFIPLAGDNSRDLIVSKFDNCHNEVWSKVYYSSGSLGISDAVYNNNRIGVLLRAGPNNKHILLLELDTDGNVIFNKLYQHSLHDNSISINTNNGSYQIWGGVFYGGSTNASAKLFLDITDQGDISKSELIRATPESDVSYFGYTGIVLNDGSRVASGSDFLVKINANNNIVWAKSFNIDFLGIAESATLSSTGITYQMQKNELVFFIKVNFDGDILWISDSMDLIYWSASVDLSNDSLDIVSIVSDSKDPVSIIIDNNTGDILSYSAFGFNLFSDYQFPSHIRNSLGDLIISSSHLINFSEHQWEDILLINPQLSHCLGAANLTVSPAPNIETSELSAESFETLSVDFSTEEYNVSMVEIDFVYEEKCRTFQETIIDTTFRCDEEYVFNNEFPNSEYNWSDGSIDSIRIFNNDRYLQAEISSCKADILLELNVLEDNCPCDVYVPNAIAPRSLDPRVNQFRSYSTCEFVYYNLSVYDRYGQVVFSSKDYNSSWLGDIKGYILMDGNYNYTLEYQVLGTASKVYKNGSLAIIR